MAKNWIAVYPIAIKCSSGAHRVIYNDLTVKSVVPQNLPMNSSNLSDH